jgi:Flp pilus assembly protein TadD
MAASIDLTYAPALRLIESGDLAGAAQILGKILNSRPQDGQSRYLLGMCYLHMRNFFAAESHFRALVKGSPSHYRAIYNLGLSLEGQGRRQEAARVYQHVLALRPDFSKARTRLARLQTGGPQSRVAPRARNANANAQPTWTWYDRAGGPEPPSLYKLFHWACLSFVIVLILLVIGGFIAAGVFVSSGLR